MNADSPRWLRVLGAACLLAAWLAPAAAQERISVEDLKVRSAAGDRSATRQIAEMYYVGRGGVEQDFKEAATWYEKLAKQGDARAQTSLGLMYARGYGVARNMDTARKWWSFAAAQNDPGAQFNLGVIYSKGEGVEPDYPQAAQWLNRASQRGHVQAQRLLGLLHYEGKGVARDPVRAYYWLKVAALQGDDVAQESLKVVGKGMSADHVREAEAQAAAWMKKAKKILK